MNIKTGRKPLQKSRWALMLIVSATVLGVALGGIGAGAINKKMRSDQRTEDLKPHLDRIANPFRLGVNRHMYDRKITNHNKETP